MSSKTKKPAITKEQYIDNLIKTFTRMYQVVYFETREPTEEMFAAYKALQSQPLNQANSSELTARIEKSLDTFQNLSKKVKKCYKESNIPVALRLSLSGVRSFTAEKISSCINADKSMLKYIETGDPAHLEKVCSLIEPMSLNWQASHKTG